METKFCSDCKQYLCLSCFYPDKRKPGKFRYLCKDCQKKRQQQWQKKNRKYHNEKAKKWNHDHPEIVKQMNKRNYQQTNLRRNALKELVLNKYPCLICGEKRHGCLVFHHLDPKQKERQVASHSFSVKKMKEEMEKCVVLCGNCHMLLHVNEIVLPSDVKPISFQDVNLQNVLNA